MIWVLIVFFEKEITMDVWFFYACCSSRKELIAENRNVTSLKVNHQFPMLLLIQLSDFHSQETCKCWWSAEIPRSFGVLFPFIHKVGGIITTWGWNNNKGFFCLFLTTSNGYALRYWNLLRRDQDRKKIPTWNYRPT